MNYGKIVTITLVLILALLIACASKGAPPTAPVATAPVPVDKETAKEGWEVEWERTLKDAQKEGRVVIYSDAVGVREASDLFTKKYGIKVELVIARGAELGTRTIKERAAGIYVLDIQISGLNTLFGVLKTGGATASIEKSLILPEVKDPKLWLNGRLPWADEARHIFTMVKSPNAPVAINTEHVKLGELRSYLDLLKPRWKGKLIINDPTLAGPGFNGFATLIFSKVVDEDFFRQLVKNNPDTSRDHRLQVEWLARGKYHAALWARPSAVFDFQEAGAPLEQVVPEEGTYLSSAGGNLALIDKAAHPNAAVIYINWLLSKEGAQVFQDAYGRQSAREDVLYDKFPRVLTRQPGVKYFASANEVERWVLEEQEKYLERAREIFNIR